MESRIRTEFIKRILQEEGCEIERDQMAAIDKYLHFRTGRLLNDRRQEVDQSEFDGQLKMTHPIRERFLDIKPKNKFFKTSRKRRRTYPIHNRIIFGRYNRIAYKLMYNLTEEVAEHIKSELDNQNI